MDHGGWRGLLASVAVAAVTAGIVALLAVFLDSVSAVAAVLLLSIVWLGTSWRLEYELSFARGELIRHDYFCGFRVRSKSVCGPAATYALSPGVAYDEGKEVRFDSEVTALVGMEVEKGGAVRRTLILYAENKRQLNMLEDLADTLNTRNRIGIEKNPETP